ncbi:GNAT family N-acetyltransferase [Myroides sp. NP-2]|uniref:GNAT family N-acetyltransferase n=1 Tax=Myroides sp. NP-2 TaxID=2759945 RepID=UPI0015FE41FD|nr:GNAT family N-acetyltransferase [Myroides sp. NP-2]MBB1150453.1 GNAT family N-acetyltransferase [Myroides sp. NP-2]
MIRPINTTDYPRLLCIWESAVLATHDFLTSEDFSYYKTHLPSYFSFVTLWGYEEEGKLVGFMGISGNSLEMLFIDETTRGRGIGKALIQFGMQEQGIRKVEVNEQNTQALGFYEYLGFKVINRLEVDGQGKPYPILQLEL